LGMCFSMTIRFDQPIQHRRPGRTLRNYTFENRAEIARPLGYR
jgi:hypothetical protein